MAKILLYLSLAVIVATAALGFMSKQRVEGVKTTLKTTQASEKQARDQATKLSGELKETNGKLTEEPTLAQTSGSARLDEGALKLAKAASGHYQPGTEDGAPATLCNVFKIKFELRN